LLEYQNVLLIIFNVPTKLFLDLQIQQNFRSLSKIVLFVPFFWRWYQPIKS